jgi:hypothetical protein
LRRRLLVAGRSRPRTSSDITTARIGRRAVGRHVANSMSRSTGQAAQGSGELGNATLLSSKNQSWRPTLKPRCYLGWSSPPRSSGISASCQWSKSAGCGAGSKPTKGAVLGQFRCRRAATRGRGTLSQESEPWIERLNPRRDYARRNFEVHCKEQLSFADCTSDKRFRQIRGVRIGLVSPPGLEPGTP